MLWLVHRRRGRRRPVRFCPLGVDRPYAGRVAAGPPTAPLGGHPSMVRPRWLQPGSPMKALAALEAYRAGDVPLDELLSDIEKTFRSGEVAEQRAILDRLSDQKYVKGLPPAALQTITSTIADAAEQASGGSLSRAGTNQS